MSTQNTQGADAAQAAGQSQAQVATTAENASNSATDTTGQAPATQPKTYDEAYVRQLRAEAAGYRTKLQAIEDKDKSELERANDRIKELSGYKDENRRLKVQVAAGKLGIIDPDAAALLLPADTAEDKIEESLQAMIAQRPWLKAQQQPALPNTTTSNPPRQNTTFTLDQIKRMTPEEINANWAEVQKVLASTK